jgi:two-component system response regulator AtoC
MIPPVANLLVVEPDASAAAPLLEMLAARGHVSERLTTADQAINALDRAHYDLLITELKLPGHSGIDLLSRVLRGWPGLAVIMVAGKSTVPEAVEAMKQGASEFLLKPFSAEEIAYVVEKVLASALSREGQPPASPLAPGAMLVGQAEPMRNVRELIRRAAAASTTVVIRGETGTGKELVARAIHEASARAARPFVKIDCASLPDTLLESELFGYEKGAFTGALARKPGRVELAEGGTLFLDEFGDVSPLLQSRLLRLLQERAFEKLGGKQTLHVDARFVLATHRDLEAMVQNGALRQDLFYRVNVLPLWLPPLRARRADIELLARHFCARFAHENRRPALTFSAEAFRFLRSQRWPGNVRQLENFVERVVLLAEGDIIELADIERELLERPRFVTQSTGATDTTDVDRTSSDGAKPASALALDDAVRKAETETVMHALSRTGGNRSAAARLLRVSRATLYNKLKELGIDQG